MAAEYNGLDRRDSTALNLSATSTALAIEVGRVGAQAGAIKEIEEKACSRLKISRREDQAFIDKEQPKGGVLENIEKWVFS